MVDVKECPGNLKQQKRQKLYEAIETEALTYGAGSGSGGTPFSFFFWGGVGGGSFHRDASILGDPQSTPRLIPISLD